MAEIMVILEKADEETKELERENFIDALDDLLFKFEMEYCVIQFNNFPAGSKEDEEQQDDFYSYMHGAVDVAIQMIDRDRNSEAIAGAANYIVNSLNDMGLENVCSCELDENYTAIFYGYCLDFATTYFNKCYRRYEDDGNG